MSWTRIKVSDELGERIHRAAKARGVTPVSLLTEIMDRADRLQREEAVGRAFASLSQDDDYWAEMRVWDVIANEAPPEG